MGLPRVMWMSSHTSIQEAMVAIMAEVDPISKARVNQGQGYKFRGIDDVYQALQAIMASHGVFTTSEVMDRPVYDEFPSGKNATRTFRTRAIFKFTFHHVSGTSVTTEVIGEGMDSGDKASNKAMSVAHKYALLQAFMVPTEDPKDPENQSHEIPAATPKEAPKAPAITPAQEEARKEVLAYLTSIKPSLSAGQVKELGDDLKAMKLTPELIKAKAEKMVAGTWDAEEAAKIFDSIWGGATR